MPEYWIVDPEELAVNVIQAGHADRVERERLTWSPPGASAPLPFAVADAF
ncbi:MAG TPA: hypothetical protein VLE53_12400 [Gemmatimonadaceae bacterium]|nr:hypothetical protein [Gemmatimonadaceae bacterium]